MAQAAKGGNVAADMKPADYRAAVKRLGTIDAKKSKQQSIAKEIGDIYSACETLHGVDKTAAKIFKALLKLEPDEMRRTFRDLNGLLDASGAMSEDSDLVDQAEDKVVHMRFGKQDAENAGEGVDDEIDQLVGDSDVVDGVSTTGGDDFEEATEEELAAQRPRQEAAEAKAVTASGRAKKPEPEPYTGDNSDLAAAGDDEPAPGTGAAAMKAMNARAKAGDDAK